MTTAPELFRLPEAGVIATALADLRAQPDHKSELTSQLLFGETIEALELTEDGRWLRARGEDGYAGWLRVWAIAPCSADEARAWRGRATLRVTAPWIWRLEGGGPLPHGARLAIGSDGTAEGPLGQIALGARERRALRPWPRLEPGTRARAALVVRAARSFLGVPYLWGGRSAAGLDCSALIQLAFAAAGVGLPRDAKDQCEVLGGRARLLRPGRAKPKAGDLLFFATGDRPVTHVALSTGGSDLLHAYGQVTVGSLVTGSADFVEELARTWIGFARAPLGGAAQAG